MASSASPKTTTSLTPARAAASLAVARKGGIVTSRPAPAPASWPASSSAVSRGLATVTAPPAAIAP